MDDQMFLIFMKITTYNSRSFHVEALKEPPIRNSKILCALKPQEKAPMVYIYTIWLSGYIIMKGKGTCPGNTTICSGSIFVRPS